MEESDRSLPKEEFLKKAGGELSVMTARADQRLEDAIKYATKIGGKKYQGNFIEVSGLLTSAMRSGSLVLELTPEQLQYIVPLFVVGHDYLLQVVSKRAMEAIGGVDKDG